MDKKTPHDLVKHGKAFEKMVHEAFEPMRLKYPIGWERVLDSAAAGNLVRKAESDFRLVVNSGIEGQPYLYVIECKASVQFYTLGACFRRLIKDGQRAKMVMAKRSGAIGVYLYHNVVNSQIEVWEATAINDAWPLKRQPFFGVPRVTIAEANLQKFAGLVAREPTYFYNLLLGGNV